MSTLNIVFYKSAPCNISIFLSEMHMYNTRILLHGSLNIKTFQIKPKNQNLCVDVGLK